MRHSEYHVIQRSGRWWVTLDGIRQGPFVSRQIAIESAVSLAKIDFKACKSARVSVDNEGVMDVAYDSGED